ncbi:MAG: hypothetical protein JXR68_02880 [Bacteroidales bacterium]|nr:hypothetical protein [Bacteroidales bacterium]
MPKKFIFHIALIGILALQLSTLSSCKNRDDDLNLTDSTTYNINPVIGQESIDEIIGSFSSPVEMAASMKSLDVEFSKKYLIDPGLTEDYDSNNKKAFALGVLSADLGYLNIYERTNLIVQYLSAIKRLSDDLRVSQFFEFQTLKRLATSNDNIDSLQFLSVQSFRDMDEYLRQSGQSSLSLLAITGVWLESLYLLTQVANETNQAQLKDKIGEQKISFDLLYGVIQLYRDDPYYVDLLNDLKELKNIFDQVEITYQVGEPETIIQNGTVTIIQNEQSIVEMSDEQLEQIILTTEKIRNKLINL